jgi:hypothetical protein
MEKQSYALVKSLKYLRDYIVHSQVIAYVPFAIIKDILVQTDSEGKRGKWIAKLQEYDLEIIPTKLIRVQWLAILLTKTNYRVLGTNLVSQGMVVAELIIEEVEQPILPIDPKFSKSKWYKEVIFYLQHL